MGNCLVREIPMQILVNDFGDKVTSQLMIPDELQVNLSCSLMFACQLTLNTNSISKGLYSQLKPLVEYVLDTQFFNFSHEIGECWGNVSNRENRDFVLRNDIGHVYQIAYRINEFLDKNYKLNAS